MSKLLISSLAPTSLCDHWYSSHAQRRLRALDWQHLTMSYLDITFFSAHCSDLRRTIISPFQFAKAFLIIVIIIVVTIIISVWTIPKSKNLLVNMPFDTVLICFSLFPVLMLLLKCIRWRTRSAMFLASISSYSVLHLFYIWRQYNRDKIYHYCFIDAVKKRISQIWNS